VSFECSSMSLLLTFYPSEDNIQTSVHYEQVIDMGRILYLRFLGARASQEAKKCGLGSGKPGEPGKPLVILERDLVTDCDGKAWDEGVRPGDTLRQARISSPTCRVLRVSGTGGEYLEDILDILAKVSPYVEPSADQNGVFVDIPIESDLGKILDFLNGLYFKVFAGLSYSKLISRAVCDLLAEEYLERGKVSSGNTPWGSVRHESLRSDRTQGDGQAGGRVVAVVAGGKEKAFLSGAPLDCLWMVPPEILSTLRSLGLKKVRDLREVSASALAEHIGDWAVMVKRWANGEERSRVQALYPPPTLSKQVDFIEPVPLQKELFHGALKELAARLIEKGVGFKTIKLSLTGDFKTLSGNQAGERKFVRPVASLEVMRTAVDAIVEGILKDISSSAPDFVPGPDSTSAADLVSAQDSAPTQESPPTPDFAPVVSGFSVELAGIAPVQAKPSPLFREEVSAKPKVIPVALKLALFGLEEKFGDRTVTWGKKDTESERFNPEIIRREKMLSIWDPMRPPVFGELPGPASAGVVADV
jgi:hypothetical protein